MTKDEQIWRRGRTDDTVSSRDFWAGDEFPEPHMESRSAPSERSWWLSDWAIACIFVGCIAAWALGIWA
jgi:hypothetical protein